MTVTAIRIAAMTQSRRRRNHRPSYAFFKPSMLSFFIGSIAAMTRDLLRSRVYVPIRRSNGGKLDRQAVSFVEIAHATAGAEL